jgi:hypothetical protein
MMHYSSKRDHSLSFPRSSLLELSRKRAEDTKKNILFHTFCLYSLSYILFVQTHTHSLSLSHTHATRTQATHTRYCHPHRTLTTASLLISGAPHTGVGQALIIVSVPSRAELEAETHQKKQILEYLMTQAVHTLI